MAIQDLKLDPSQTPGIFTISTIQDNWNPTGLGTTTLFWCQANDNEGSRISGVTAQANNEIRILMNLSTPVDDGVMVLLHESTRSLAANRFHCPNDRDLLIPKNGGVILVYGTEPDGITSRWFAVGTINREMHLTGHSLNLFPQLLMPSISGAINSWNPTPVNAQNTTFASGLGAAGVSLAAKDGAFWNLQVAAGGATLNGLLWISQSGTDPAGQGPVKFLYSLEGNGSLTLKHNNQPGTNDLFSCPYAQDFVLPAGCGCILVSNQAGGWIVMATSAYPSAPTFSSVVVTGNVKMQTEQINPSVTPAALTSGSTIANWDPTGTGAGTGNATPKNSMVRASTSTSTTATVGGMIGPGGGNAEGTTCYVLNFGGGSITFKHQGTGAAGNQFLLPNSADFTLPINAACEFIYDHNGNWWLVGHGN
jgi:hypothetical protein